MATIEAPIREEVQDTYPDGSVFGDQDLALQVRNEALEQAGKVGGGEKALRRLKRELGKTIARYRVNILFRGKPDYHGDSQAARDFVGEILDRIQDASGASKEERRQERPGLQASIAYHTRKAVETMIAEEVRQKNPDAEGDKLDQLIRKEIGRLATTTSTSDGRGRGAAAPISDQDEAAEIGGKRGEALKALGALNATTHVIAAEGILRVMSDMMDRVVSDSPKGITSKDKTKDFLTRAVEVGKVTVKVLDQKATEADLKAARSLAWKAQA